MLKKISLALSLLITLSASAASLQPEQVHRVTTLEVIKKLNSRHYLELAINDELSQKFLDRYLEAVDSNRQVLLADEIAKFKKQYSNSLDDKVKSGDVQAGFEIFNTYRDRLAKLLEAELNELPKTIKNMTFDGDDQIQIDRSEAPWPKDIEEVKQLQAKRLKATVLSLKLADKDPEKILETVERRYKNQLERLQQINSEDVYQLYMNAFTQLYDPHTNYMSPESSENFDISMRLKLEGIGAMLSSKDEHTKVVRLIHAGPAYKQGELKPADKIVGVGQGKQDIVDVIGWRLSDVVNLIRGPKGSVVRLEVIPAKAVSDDERKIISITRDEVKLEEQSVKKAMLDMKDSSGKVRKIGVLDIPTFYIDFEALRNRAPNYKSTTRDTAKLLSELVNDGAEGIIIDLRNNGGGSLREANELTGLFIEKGPSVQIQLANKRVHTQAKNYLSPYYDGPVVVLINRLSASASEIFAGALQDYNRAIIVGTPTFGKGTVQSLVELNHGRLKVTESKFYRISGESTQHKGVEPDIFLPETYDAELVGESSLDNALAWSTIRPASYRSMADLGFTINKLKPLSAKRVAEDADFIYINDKSEYETSLKQDMLSLNEKARRAELKEREAKRLALENTRRKAKGEDILDELEKKDEDDETADAQEPEGIDVDDAHLKEAAQILMDFKQVQATVAKTER